MNKFLLFIAFVGFLGWALDNIVSPWMDLKILQWRMRRELEQQRRLREAMEPDCICVWFGPDTLVVNPHCKAFDHGKIAETTARMTRLLQAHGPKTPYKFRKE